VAVSILSIHYFNFSGAKANNKMIGHRHTPNLTKYSLMNSLKTLFPKPLIEGTMLLVTKDICYPSEMLESIFHNHPYHSVPYSMIPELNDEIFKEIDNDCVPYNPIFYHPDEYRHRWGCKLVNTSCHFKEAKVYHTETLFHIYSSLSTIRDAYSEVVQSRGNNSPWVTSVFPYVKQMLQKESLKKDIVLFLFMQPMLEVMLTVSRQVVGQHATIDSDVSSIPFGSISFEGLLRMCCTQIGAPLTSNKYERIFQAYWSNLLFDYTASKFITQRSFISLAKMVKEGREIQELIYLKMLVIHSPLKIECDIHKLPSELVVVIGSYLIDEDNLVKSLIFADRTPPVPGSTCWGGCQRWSLQGDAILKRA
jgi:hypothetical protein